MPKTLTAAYILDSTGISSGVSKADAELGRLGTSTSKLSDDFDKNTSRMGNGFKSLGAELGNFGIPFSNSLTKMGQNLDDAKSRGQGFKQVMSDIGGAALGVGVIGVAAVGAESIKMADDFDVAQAQVQVAVKNSGESFAKTKPSIDDAEKSLANFGFNSTDAASSLSVLITSTGSTKKAEQDLSIAADLARAKHIDLSTATSILTKTLAGSTRGLTTLGLNLDIGSGKLHTIAKDTTAYHDAQDALHLVDEKVADGTLKGAAAYAALLAAHDKVDTSSQKLQLDQGTISKILDTVRDKTAGAADAFGNTLAGQEAIASAKAHDLGTSFGEFLIPKIIDAEHAVMDTVSWFEKHKTVAEALAITIGTVLAGAIGVFTVNMVSGMIGSVRSALTSLGLMAAETDTTQVSTDALTAAMTSLEAQLAALSAPEQTAASGQEALNLAWEAAEGLATTLDADLTTLAAAYEQAGLAAQQAGGEFQLAGTESATAGGEMATAGAAAGEAGMAGAMTAGEGAATGLTGALGPLALGVGVVALGTMALSHVITDHSIPAFVQARTAADALSENSLPQITVKLDALRQAQDNAARGMHGNSAEAQLAKINYQYLSSQIDTLRAEQTQMTNNLGILSAAFGLNQSQALSVATALGVNLKSALDPAQVNAFGQQVSQMGLNMDTTGTKAGTLSANTVAAMSQMYGAVQQATSSSEWLGIGQSMAMGVANGINAYSGFSVSAMENLINTTAGAAHGLIQNPPYPSALFREEIGKSISAGVASGILDGTPLVKSAMDSTVKAAAGVGLPSAAALAGMSGASSTGGGAAAPSQLNVYVTVQGHVLTDRQLTDSVWEGLIEKGVVNGSGGQLVQAG
jgi:hypothetical protein